MRPEEDGLQAPKPASTVILARHSISGPEIYLLKRSGGSPFFPGSYVFPGGTVDEEDRNTTFWRSHVDLSVEEISQKLGGGLSEEDALSHGIAALRETFEEAGVLLAHGLKENGEETESICRIRRDGKLPRAWLREWVISGQWLLSVSGLIPWSHWITPEAMMSRFDTRFYLAPMPEGQECIPDTRETIHGLWIKPYEALAGNLRGEVPLSPPTLVTLQELLPYSTLRDLEMSAKGRPWGEARLPRLVMLEKGAMILEPWDPMINDEFEVVPSQRKARVLAVGEPFSRLWYDDGIWRPVGI